MESNQQVIRHQVSEVEFGFYTAEEIQKLSVKRITSRLAFDGLGNPVINGLYDPALGPIDFSKICPTCHLTQKECPGHMGHIELPVPVYNPILFTTMYSLLKQKCMSCHKFRTDESTTRVFRVKVLLLDAGYIDEAETLMELLAQNNADFEESNLQKIKRQQKLLDDLERMALSCPKSHTELPYTVEVERMNTIARFMKNTTQKCANCRAYSPKMRQDNHTKIFLKPLSRTMNQKNLQNNASLSSAMDRMRENDDQEEEELEEVDDSDDEDDAEANDKSSFMPTLEVRSQLELLWEKEFGLAELFWGNRHVASSRKPRHRSSDGWHQFFLQVLPVAPSRFRPPVHMMDQIFEHAQNVYLGKIIQLAEQLVQNDIKRIIPSEEEKAQEGEEDAAAPKLQVNLATKIRLWTTLQDQVNCLFDNSHAKRPQDMPQGIRQIIEKKEGLFRKHMMGKRVNYSARSVISPDPYIGSSEIGVPLRFAKKLTYPQPVTPWNVAEMRQLVINGPDIHPGANFVENEHGILIDLGKRTKDQRVAISKTLLTRSSSAEGLAKHTVKRVWRHLITGDVVLMNRQPTLHKPSMMAHVTRVLTNPELQTIRMHYVNCNTFNADFDGDEMNMHFPQNELARAEAYLIASNDNQYIVPTDGSPLRGLIQDHVDSGVKLTKRDTFIDQDMYMQLLFSAWTCMDHLGADRGHIKTIAPALLKPKKLWTGKQVISTLLLQLTEGLPTLNLDSKTRVKENAFGKDNAEHIVIFRDNELLQGVLDKSQFGASANGLVHSVYEIYGARMAADLLTALGRLFTTYLQFAGHTCALEDLTLTLEAEAERKSLVDASVVAGQKAYAEFVEMDTTSDDDLLTEDERSNVREKMRHLMAQDVQAGVDYNAQALDSKIMQCVHKSNSEIIKACLPNGQIKPFPANSFSLMVLTGAKGSMVNHTQISCGLGQQALEGRRVPILVSGRSLPSFEPFDPSPRAGGYITDRFLTGLRPQEYYHHCMAGREGLVDTAVKTSRSGYLQRCLVKHLEDLVVGYDHTVRNTDGNVIQFLYGEDGIDPMENSLLTGEKDRMAFMAMNHVSLSHKFSIHGQFFENTGLDMMESIKYNKMLQKCKKLVESNRFRTGQTVRARMQLDRAAPWTQENVAKGWHDAEIQQVHKKSQTFDLVYKETGHVAKAVPLSIDSSSDRVSASQKYTFLPGSIPLLQHQIPDPILHALPLSKHVGIISEKLQQDIKEYNANATHQEGENSVSSAAFELLVWVKYLRSLVQPGENVGTLAAQSIGEPSTQMTLNTFHLAGHGAANVTLGIPRLREIIMTASQKMKTPAMTIPLLPSVTRQDASRIEQHLNRISLESLVKNNKGIGVIEQLMPSLDQVTWVREYRIQLSFFPIEAISKSFGISSKDLYKCATGVFLRQLFKLIEKQFKTNGDKKGIESSVDPDYVPPRRTKKKSKMDQDEDAEEQGTLSFGRKKEISGYDEDDAEDEDEEENSIEMESEDEDERLTSATGTATTTEGFTPLDIDGDFNYFYGCSRNKDKGIFEVVVRAPIEFKKLLLVPVIKQAATTSYVRQHKGITKSFYVQQRMGSVEVPCIQTEGINFQAIWQLDHVLAVDQLMTNDIYQMLQVYGVEAARACISKQIQDVFGVYGISVNARHLNLLADYMTFEGSYKALNRSGMKLKGSPFQQITFETSMGFLTSAATYGLKDKMQSPSAQLILGQPVKVGTGSFSLLQPVLF